MEVLDRGQTWVLDLLLEIAGDQATLVQALQTATREGNEPPSVKAVIQRILALHRDKGTFPQLLERLRANLGSISSDDPSLVATE